MIKYTHQYTIKLSTQLLKNTMDGDKKLIAKYIPWQAGHFHDGNMGLLSHSGINSAGEMWQYPRRRIGKLGTGSFGFTMRWILNCLDSTFALNQRTILGVANRGDPTNTNEYDWNNVDNAL